MRAIAALLLLAAFTFAARAAPYDWGPIVKTFEPSASGDYKGTFTRRGTSNVYDAEWIYVPTGQKFTDVLEVRGVAAGVLTVFRRGNQGVYTFPIRSGVPGRGKASWVSDPTYYVEVSQAPATAASSAAKPEKWLVAKANDGAFGYDALSIRKAKAAGRMVVHWAAYSPTPVPNESGAWTYSVNESEVDCAARRAAVLTMVTFDHNGTSIDVAVPPGPPLWKPVPAKGLEALLFGLTCENAGLDRARIAGPFEALFPELKKTAQ